MNVVIGFALLLIHCNEAMKVITSESENESESEKSENVDKERNNTLETYLHFSFFCPYTNIVFTCNACNYYHYHCHFHHYYSRYYYYFERTKLFERQEETININIIKKM